MAKWELKKRLRGLSRQRGLDTAPWSLMEPQIQQNGSHFVCLLRSSPKGIKWKWKLNRFWGQHYRGLSSDLYGMGTKRNQGDRLLRDRHLGPSQTMAPIWSEGPDKSVIGHDNGSQNFYVFDLHIWITDWEMCVGWGEDFLWELVRNKLIFP